MLFSVIVPIYKIEKYLKTCIDSVLAQTCSDWELILVDDGSPDACPQICDDYAARDPRIQVVHKENGGLVSARQAGIRLAKGEYIFNLDGDDALTPDALEHAEKIIAECGADIVSFSYQIFTNGALGDVVDDLAPEGLYQRAQLEETVFPKLLSDKNMEHMFYFVWGKAIRRTLILPHQLNVNPAISLGEDLSCMVPCYLDAQSVCFSRKIAYLYTIRNDSLSTDFKTHQITQIANAISGLRELPMEKPADFDAQIARYSCFMCFAILAAAAEGGHFSALKSLKNLIQTSLHKEEIQKAQFETISKKSRIAISLMKAGRLGLAFYFLYFCKVLKTLKG